MNNPFDRDRSAAIASQNNPFDSDPTHARNRFPDIAQASHLGTPTSPGVYQQNQQNSWSQYGQQSQFSSPYGQQSPSSYGTAAGASPYPSIPSSPYSTAGFAGGVASGGSYTNPMTSPHMMVPTGTPYSHFTGASTAAGGGYQQGPSVFMSDQNVPRNYATNPQLSQFDPLGSAGGGGYGQQQQQQQRQHQGSYSGGGAGGGVPNNFNSSAPFQLQGGQSEIDPGPITWYPRSPANPGVQIVTAFNGQTTLHVPIRPHSYTANDHPRHIISMHRVELEQWDQYGWRQALNALENLRIAWEGVRDDIARVTDIGCPPHENAITLKMKKEAVEKIDNVTAAYLQMQEVYSSYRQSPDPSSKRRVRECLNAGLRNLPEWP